MAYISTYQHDYYPRIDMKRVRLRPIQEIQQLSRKQARNLADPIPIRTNPLTVIDQCLINQPNRYLLNLPNNNGKLYKKLKMQTPNDVERSRNFSEMKSTYRIDYGHAKEWLEGVYN